MASEHEKALNLQNDVLQITRELADEIGKLPSQRDRDAIADLWRKVGNHRSRLSASYRALRKIPRLPRSQLSRADYEAQKIVAQDAKLLGQRLKKWTWIDKQIARHMDPVANPIELTFADPDRSSMLDMMYYSLFLMANPNAQSKDAEDHGCFADIPLNIQPFQTLLRAAYRLLLVQGRTDAARFLDVGCGGGTKVLAASLYFPECHGFDYDHDYVAAGSRLLEITNSEGCQIFQADGLTFDDYGTYDVIYFYRPLREDALLIQMEDHIFANARPGTVILAPYTGFLSPRAGNNHPCVSSCIFIAGMDQSQVDALHKEAEFTDTEQVIRPKDMKFDTGFWTPILQQATLNGSE